MTLRDTLWSQDRVVRGYIVTVCLLSLFMVYGFRAVELEVLRLAEIGLLINLVECALLVVGLIIWAYLVWKSVGMARRPAPSFALLVAVIAMPLASYFAPIPPTREEVRLWQRRDEYEAIALEVFTRAKYRDGTCVSSDAQERDLSERCLLVSSNSVFFAVYHGMVFLVYSVDGSPPTDMYCGGDGYVWKRIDQHWSICKANLG